MEKDDFFMGQTGMNENISEKHHSFSLIVNG